MNYRHAYHAGNFADVHKHALLVALLEHLKRKPAPFFYLDTHAGRGVYDLVAPPPGRSAEWQAGIGRLLARGARHPGSAIDACLNALRTAGAKLDPPAALRYPGSPLLARSVMRRSDRAVFAELHPGEIEDLRALMRGHAHTSVEHTDGYATLNAHLPPRERRGLVFIDPPYERASEFANLGQALERGLARWRTGLFASWYPIKQGTQVTTFFERIAASGVRRVLRCELRIRPLDAAPGLAGSGLLVVNPPWQFDTLARSIQAELLAELATDPGADASVEWLVPE